MELWIEIYGETNIGPEALRSSLWNPECSEEMLQDSLQPGSWEQIPEG